MMRALWSIIMLTFRNAVRSHVFQLLLAVLLLCIIVIPVSISVNKAEEFIQVSLLYSLWAVSVVLALSSLWLGCFVMSHDIDGYQIHMVITKPVSRLKIWLGKWLGINLINLLLLFVSGLTVYLIVMSRYQAAAVESRYAERQNEREKAAGEHRRIASRVLVGRRSFMPVRMSADEVADKITAVRREQARQQGRVLSADEEKAIREQAAKQYSATQIAPGKSTSWKFADVPVKLNEEEISLRYRPYLGKVSSEDQRETDLKIVLAEPVVDPVTGTYITRSQELVQRVFTGVFHEISLPKGMIAPDGTVTVSIQNLDRSGAAHFYQEADGPALLLPVCSFEENYARGMVVLMVQLLLLSGIACAFGGFLTMPTAVFMVASYLLFGMFSMILTDSEFYVGGAIDSLGQRLAQAILLVVIPLHKFDITSLLSGGELIEFAYIWELFWKYFLLRGVPLFLFGIWLYNRREVGLEVRK